LEAKLNFVRNSNNEKVLLNSNYRLDLLFIQQSRNLMPQIRALANSIFSIGKPKY